MVDEHKRFLHGLAQYPQGPWKAIAAIFGTKSARQTMTHAQKYRQKIGRRLRGERYHKPLISVGTPTVNYAYQSTQPMYTYYHYHQAASQNLVMHSPLDTSSAFDAGFDDILFSQRIEDLLDMLK